MITPRNGFLRVLFTAGVLSDAHVLELEYDGLSAPLAFSASEDLEEAAQRWAESHPGATGAGCRNATCLVSLLVDTMRARLNDDDTLKRSETYEGLMRHYKAALDLAVPRGVNDQKEFLGVIRDARIVCGEGLKNTPDTKTTAAALAAIEDLVRADEGSLAFGLEQTAGFCSGVADVRATEFATRSPQLAARRGLHQRLANEALRPTLTHGEARLLAASNAAGYAVAAYAALCAASLDKLRAHALKFGATASLEIGSSLAAAWFSSSLARLKRPARGNPLVFPSRGEPFALPWTVRAPGVVAMDERLEFDSAQFGGLHDAALEHAAAQYRWIASRMIPCETTENLTLAAEGLDALASAARRWRARQGAGAHHASLAHLASLAPSASTVAIVAARGLFGRLACIAPQPREGPERVARRIAAAEADAVTAAFAARGVAVVDDFLTADAAAALRDFVLGSTVFTRAYVQGYLGAFLADGFGASPVVQQLADELRTFVFPELLSGAQLRQAWAYVYARRRDDNDGASHPRGIDAHADDADVSVNVWITPDSANLNPRSGGLVIYNSTPPDHWSFERANRDAVAIDDFLQRRTHDAIVVPYKYNRATLLNGFRFHKTDALHFRRGLENHRINLTFLFKVRTIAPL
ncbi:hypothetical protein CTAYLR_009813 [Chrysophaeum taylorii]|uniref:Uncharacterized protein n=1 Tax=Chrysophaeum taylorii TaxID=2483200 RepID=A0AAD7U669_9STRA|nr:hypothetical protein CTAYLR_009813 [Chrysophaeum taylorii]